jgi:hypothetical protein
MTLTGYPLALVIVLTLVLLTFRLCITTGHSPQLLSASALRHLQAGAALGPTLVEWSGFLGVAEETKVREDIW